MWLFVSIIIISTISVVYCSVKGGDMMEDSKEVATSYYRNRGETGHIPRFTSTTRVAYIDDNPRDQKSYRYYGTGSKSGNSFAPTSIHKSSSSNNYFITTKARENTHTGNKDMDTAGTGNSGDNNQYLTVYESPSSQSASAANHMMMMLAGQDPGTEDAFGNLAAETGHGGGYGHGGHGGGKGCNSALGLLGVLGLAAYLQQVLMNMQNQTAGRKRRDVSTSDLDTSFDSDLTKLENIKKGMAHLDLHLLPLNETTEILELDEDTYSQVMQDVFPLLSAVAHARDGLIPVHCTHSSVCQANQALVEDLGSAGHSIGSQISTAIAKLLSRITKDERAEQIRMISKAGKMGRNGRNCTKIFPTCNRLKKLPVYNIPPFILN